MRKLALFLLLASPAMAQTPAGKVHNSLPVRFVRLGAGTVETMVYPRHHWKEWAFLDANFLANGYDARASDMLYKECVGCAETNPILGAHPGPGALYSFKFGIGFLENMGTHALANKARSEHFPVVVTFIPASILGGASVYAGNFAYFGQGGYLTWHSCNHDPNCFPHRK